MPAIIVGLVVLFFGRSLTHLAADVLWYRSVGYEAVLWTRLGAQLGLLALGALLAIAVLFGIP
ncbi:MAG: UPF0182 family protein [Chloroflexi bacterium]|nr:UPF0182 family protein [Chloroflexota bacterium]